MAKAAKKFFSFLVLTAFIFSIVIGGLVNSTKAFAEDAPEELIVPVQMHSDNGWVETAPGEWESMNNPEDNSKQTLVGFFSAPSSGAWLSFEWMVNCEVDYDGLSFYVMGPVGYRAGGRITGTAMVEYQKKEQFVNRAGYYRFIVSFDKDIADGDGLDKGFVKNIVVSKSSTTTALAIPKQIFSNTDGLKSLRTDGTKEAGQIYFGSENGTEIPWWITGSEDPGSITLYSVNPIITTEKAAGLFTPEKESLFFAYNLYNTTMSNGDITTAVGALPNFPYAESYECVYENGYVPADVDTNHYGMSIIRRILRGQHPFLNPLEDWFKAEEAEQILYSTVSTADSKATLATGSSIAYKTTEKLYLPSGERVSGVRTLTVYAGESDNLGIYYQHWAPSSWLRSPRTAVVAGNTIQDNIFTNTGIGVVDATGSGDGYISAAPAFKLSLESIVFASTLQNTVPAGKDGKFFEISASDAMTLRYKDGSSILGGTEYLPEATVSKPSIGSTILNYTNAPADSRLMIIATDPNGVVQQFVKEFDAKTSGSIDLITLDGIDSGTTYSVRAWIEKDTLNGLIAAINPTNEFIFNISSAFENTVKHLEKGSVKLELNEDEYFYESYSLVIVKKDLSSLEQSILNNNIGALVNNNKVLDVYNIKVVDSQGYEIDCSNTSMTIAINRIYYNVSDIKIVFLGTNNTVMPSAVNGNEITFVTDQLGDFVITGVELNQSNCSHMTIIYVLSGILAFVLLVFIAREAQGRKTIIRKS